MMYRLTIFGGKRFSLNVIGEVKRYLGNRTLTKTLSDIF